VTQAHDGRQVVGMDPHRQRSVLVRMTQDGRKLETARIGNNPAALRAVIARAGKNPRVAVEAAYGWYWAAGVLQEVGAEVHLAHPPGVKAFSCRRVKNDERDCADLADLLRLGRLPGAWIAPPRSGSCPAPDRSWARSSARRPAASPGSAGPGSCARGPG
jgi:Transposase